MQAAGINGFFSLTSAASIILVLTLLQGSCGFKLRGQAQLPAEMAVTYIKSNTLRGARPSQLVAVLTQLLESNAVEVTTDPEKATAILDILNEEIRARTLAAGREGDAREYTFTYTVNYRITLADGKTLIPSSSITTFRNLIYAEVDVLGKSEGEQIARRDMESDVAQSIVRRLEVIE